MKEEKKRYPVKLPKEVLIKAVNDCRENDVKLVHFQEEENLLPTNL